MWHNKGNLIWISIATVFGVIITLLIFASGNSAWAAPNAQGTVPGPTPVPTGAPPPGPGKPPLPCLSVFTGSGPASLAGAGGTLICGNSSFTFSPNSLPINGFINLFFYYPASVPTGDKGGGFRAPGDNTVGMLLINDSGGILHSLPSGQAFTLCFSVLSDAYDQTGASERYIRWWDGSHWVALATMVSDGPNPGTLQLCAQVIQF